MSLRRWRLAAATVAAVTVFGVTAAMAQDDGSDTSAASSDRYIGYYYPGPVTEETYVARAKTLPDASRAGRIAFVTALAQEQMAAPYQPSLAMFVKGNQADKLIVVALRDGIFDTVYRMRGVLAMMTASARSTDLFKAYKVQDLFTFFDMLKLLGFQKITLTDGKSVTHTVYIK